MFAKELTLHRKKQIFKEQRAEKDSQTELSHELH